MTLTYLNARNLCDKTKVHHKDFPNVRKLVGL